MKWFNGVELIDKMMDLLGYDDIIRELVRLCYSLASYSILVEGSTTEPIQGARAIRLGDPLSPLLFIIALYLSKLTLQIVNDGDLELYKMGREVIESHLAFVNNVVFLSRASYKSFRMIRMIQVKFIDLCGL